MSRLSNRVCPRCTRTCRYPRTTERASLRLWCTSESEASIAPTKRCTSTGCSNDGGDPSWSVCGVGTLPADRAMQAALDPQDCLYTLVLKGTDGTVTPRVIGSIARYLHSPADPAAVVARMSDPVTRIVSLTITEGGYHVGDTSGEFEAPPDVFADLEPGAEPRTVFGMVIAALDRRRQAGALRVHDPVVRQHHRKRRRRPAQLHRLRRDEESGARALDRGATSPSLARWSTASHR